MKLGLYLRRFMPVFLRRPVSTIDALARFVSLSEIEQVVLQTADRRAVVQELSRRLEQSEQLLLGRLSTVMGLGIVSSIAPVDDLSALAIENYRKAGAIPLVHNKMTTGIVCVDPELYLAHYPEEKDVTFYLGLWEDISKALDESEVQRKQQERPNYVDGSSAATKENVKLTDDLLVKVLGFIKNEAQKYGSSSITIEKQNEQAYYCFSAGAGKSAKGNIRAKVWQPLCSALEARSTLLLQVWKLNEELKVSQMAPDSFTLEWVRVKPVLVRAEAAKTIDEETPRLAEVNSESQETCEEPEQSNEIFSVLLVEDNHTFSRVLERFFSKHNIVTDFAEHGKQGLELLREGRIAPDLIVCDVHMPQMNGFEFVKLVRQQPEFQDIPIIMLTSDDDVETELRVLGDGADAFLAKSEDPRLLGMYVRKHILKANRLRSLRKAA